MSHCTRQQAGPWPDEADEDYLDDLILARRGMQHSALAALDRIVRTRRLVATGRTIRGSVPVVSFTDVPLAELARLRVFRPHRSRWDFEPYGIGIERAWLVQRGARSVQYGNEALWQRLPPAERPFFQLGRTRARRGMRTIDWTVEREWRHVGDVDLRYLAPEQGLLFVPTKAAADELAAISPWPVTVLNSSAP